MRDEKGLRRQWALLWTLRSRHMGLSIRQMADELGVTARTIRRDLDLFRSVGFPLEEAIGDYGRKIWSIKGSRDLPLLAFTFDEALALGLGRRMLGPLDGTAFGEAARHAFQKIRAVLGPGALEYIERFSAVFHETGGKLRNYASKAEIIEGLRFAFEEGKAARILYRSEGTPEATYREIHPSGMFSHRGALYLVALDPSMDKFKHYKVDRIEEVEVGQEAPKSFENFDLAAHMAPAFAAFKGDGEATEVHVRFSPEAARYVQESKWHESQQVTPQANGSVLVRFQVCGTQEIKSWILSFGSKAVVLEPESLRLKISRELRDLADAYEKLDDPEGPPAGDPESVARDRRPHQINQAKSRER